jgi:transposase-like protein
MVQRKSTTNLTELLLECVSQPDPMLSMLKWLCDRLMEAEITAKIGADKSEHSREVKKRAEKEHPKLSNQAARPLAV